MSHEPVRILLLEDDPAHAELIRRSFESSGATAELEFVRSVADAEARLRTHVPDLLIADWRLPDGSGMDLIEGANARGCAVVIMTGFGDETRAVAAMKAGALEYVVKSETAFEELPKIAERALREWGHVIRGRKAEAALRDSEEYFRALIENAHDVISEIGPDGVIHYVSRSGTRLLGVEADDLVGHDILDSVHPDDRESTWESVAQSFAAPGISQSIEARVQHRSGEWRHVEASCSAHRAPNGDLRGVLNIRDVTDRVTAEQQRVDLEEELRRTQRLEAIGQLAGGIAHDFNNLLTIIGGHAELLEMDAEAGDEIDWADRLKEIRTAQESAASLTRQLLTFGRRQVIQPVVLDLNDVVLEVERMMVRVLRENIRLDTELAATAIKAKLDPGQIQQIIINLVVNARDALPDGGRITVGTALELLEAPKTVGGDELSPGPYAVLTVQDDGLGMEPEVLQRIFDPFFTTKPRGRGTGLGLATVFGIVRQARGGISVRSEPDGGTRFDVYLPCSGRDLDATTVVRKSGAAPRGSERVLVVEDDPGLQGLVIGVLEGLGYEVLEASTADEAARILRTPDTDIHLMLTDLVLPDGNGRRLAEDAAATRPEMRIMFMSGYADDVLGPDAVLDASVPFLAKPFTTSALAETVRSTLDRVPYERGAAAPSSRAGED